MVAVSSRPFAVHIAEPLTTLTLHPTQTRVAPYLATLFPLEGDVPAGSALASADDRELSSSTLSTWPDGSAKVMVLAGRVGVEADAPKAIRLHVAAPRGIDLTPARVAELITSVDVDIPGVGAGSVADLAAPAKTWWVNPTVICARYYAPILADGAATGMVAVVDVHAFAAPATEALVEVAVENALIDPSPDEPIAPTAKVFTGATVRVNGTPIEMDGSSTFSSPVDGVTLIGGDRAAGVTEAHGGEGGELHWQHSTMTKFRAFACWTWIGGDPGIEATHDRDYLQQHPIFWRSARDASE
jgi:hypothetical protein